MGGGEATPPCCLTTALYIPLRRGSGPLAELLPTGRRFPASGDKKGRLLPHLAAPHRASPHLASGRLILALAPRPNLSPKPHPGPEQVRLAPPAVIEEAIRPRG